MHHKMGETRVVVDPCSENKICGANGDRSNGSRTSLHSCSCGPDCGPDKCDGRKSSSLVAWDEMRTRIFLVLIAAFALWLLVYVPISVVNLPSEKSESHDHDHDHHHVHGP